MKTVRVSDDNYWTLYEMSVAYDVSFPVVISKVLDRLDQQKDQIRYLEYDRAQLVKERNELLRNVKSGARKSVTS